MSFFAFRAHPQWPSTDDIRGPRGLPRCNPKGAPRKRTNPKVEFPKKHKQARVSFRQRKKNDGRKERDFAPILVLRVSLELSMGIVLMRFPCVTIHTFAN